ncbi:MAG: aromatic amino acid lyase [Cryobacterium sp.]|nr:aromatic amino acid lyase [Oligoflexia bacterium]
MTLPQRDDRAASLESPSRTDDLAAESIAWLERLGLQDLVFESSRSDFERVRVSFESCMSFLHSHPSRVYGVHTGYGADVTTKKDPSDWRTTQRELLDYLCVGVGEALSPQIVRRGLRIQAWKTAQGYSGVHPETFRSLCELSNRSDLPTVPRHGSLGASGDLIPMAHAIAPLFKETLPRGPRDVIGLVNTNSMMSAFAVELFSRARRIVTSAVETTALSAIALGGVTEPFESRGLGINPARPYPRRVGEEILDAQAHMKRIVGWTGEGAIPIQFPLLQERYSIRCAPQVLGICRWNLESAGERIVSEALSVADNPVFTQGSFWHGGHFYAVGLSTAADLIADSVARASELLDRQCLLLVDSELSHGLPPNLVHPGAGHVKGIHQLISSLLQSVRAHGVPSRNLSFSCESNNQDVVPAAMAALISLDQMIQTAAEITRASRFIAQRAATLRATGSVPKTLNLESWNAFESA